MKKFLGIFLFISLTMILTVALLPNLDIGQLREKSIDSLAALSHKRKNQVLSVEKAIPPETKAFPKVPIVDRPIKWTSRRSELAKEYAQIHYGMTIDTIIPKAVVVHWTAMENGDSVYRFFYPEETSDPEYDGTGKLNVASHFLVDRDGTIYRLTPETALNRHAIGLNWCSIGIENVGGTGNAQNLTEEQLQANLSLIRYLQDKYPTISYVLGHYQQDYGKKAGIWIEKLPDYYAIKPDPGPLFMNKLKANLQDTDLKFFPIE
ncbi:MAG: peptidoglycan recognition family protein [Bacillota bacterium]